MAVSKATIRQWLLEAQKENATHCIIVCDSFDYEDYPVPVLKSQSVSERLKEFTFENMQRVMEVYDLRKPLEPQLAQGREYNL